MFFAVFLEVFGQHSTTYYNKATESGSTANSGSNYCLNLTHRPMADTQGELHQYLKANNLNAIFVSIVEAILIEKPDNPIGFMTKFLLVSTFFLWCDFHRENTIGHCSEILLLWVPCIG